jgi:LCP family protein required for cell wall assembly
MSGTSVNDFFSHQAREARGPEPERPAKRRSKRSKVLRRVALASGIALVVGAGAVVGGGYYAVSHLAGSVHRIQGITALTAADQPLMPAASRRSTTVLLTGDSTLPAERGGSGVDHSSPDPEAISGLIAIVHLDANGRAGAVVDLPPDVVVSVPGFGQMELGNTLKLGGPSLLIKTVEHLTNVRINDYSVVDFAGVRSVVGAMGGVNIDAPFNMVGEGVHFPKGIDHLGAADVLPYVKQADVSEIGREDLQSGLIRAVMDKIAQRRMFSRVRTDFRVLNAAAAAFSVDSNLSDHALESLGLKLGDLRGRDGTFVTAPTSGSPLSGGDGAVFLNKAVSRQLWSAIRNDSVAAFARRYPFTVTPGAPE